jgi:hypothetical protein
MSTREEKARLVEELDAAEKHLRDSRVMVGIHLREVEELIRECRNAGVRTRTVEKWEKARVFRLLAWVAGGVAVVGLFVSSWVLLVVGIGLCFSSAALRQENAP